MRSGLAGGGLFQGGVLGGCSRWEADVVTDHGFNKKGNLAMEPAEIGHNSQGEDIRLLLDRIVALEEQKRDISVDIKDIFTEAKHKGYSVKALRVVVKREMEDADQRDAREAAEREVELMLAALGDFASSPLGEAAVRRAK